MKKLYVLFVFIIIVSIGFGQVRSAKSAQANLQKQIKFPEIVRTTCDSIGWPPPNNYSILYYSLNSNNGFLSGNNAYGDKAKANYWDASANAGTFLSKVIVGIGKSNGPDLTKVVEIKVYDGTGGTPGALLGTINTTMSVMKDVAVLAGGFSIFNFSPAITLPASKRVFVSIEFPTLVWNTGIDPATKDSLGILTTNFDEPPVSLAWEKWSDDSWNPMSTSWNAGRINLHVYPLVSDNASCALPVAFGKLQGKFTNGAVALQWHTYAEIDNKGFEIERSGDGQKFSTIGKVNSKAINGNHHGQLSYAFTDLNPLNGQNIYRIKQTDINGQYAHSNIISVFARNVSSPHIRSYYPNPTTGNLVLEFSKAITGNVGIQITDAAGKLISSQRTNTTNSSSLVMNATALKAGVYMLKLTEENGSSSVIKFVKQ
jgi:Secretion system C-terminal sorting domain